MRAARTTTTTCALALTVAVGLLSGTGHAADDLDPLGALTAIGETELSNLSGRQGISISDQDLTATALGGVIAAGDDVTTGTIDFGSSMQNMHGINNQTINTGNNASLNSGVTVQIHMY
jgi:hypothetical protein